MDKIELVRARNRMEALRIDLLAEKEAAAEAIAPVELDQARVGRLSRMDSMQQQAMALEQDRRRDVQLKRIEGAFQRIENRTYGVCVKCSSPFTFWVGTGEPKTSHLVRVFVSCEFHSHNIL